ncbi:Ger(x)C family spore germination protein [Paenibacillus glycanilyticus]|uniref:Ger(x)C family spore germination protein n=1 Tax=Paenibacillus glycanilyticus TaxID=126569 RepID=UPI00203C8670|nr:Ger(x)C family spore germination protein [Paenibacillus glycanilyticus]MCM3626000.1 Ger(x)C family spore germination protein [Paenibacillus glycanilyticus]
MKKNNPYKTIVVLMSLTLLCGCWDIKEINQRALPLVMGVSKEHDKEYRVTLSIPRTNAEEKTRIVTGRGDSVSSILGQMRNNSENALDYSQLQLIVIDNKLAANQPEWIKIIKYFMTSKEIPSIALVAITDDNIETMFSNISKLGFAGTAVYDFFSKGAGWAPEVSSTRIWEVYQSLFSYTNDIAVPVVNTAKDTVLNFDGSAVLKNGKITERISPSENHLVHLFQNHTTIRNTENLGFATITVIDSSLKVKPSMKNSEPRIASDLSLKISILESDEGVSNNRLKEALEKRIEQRFNDIFKQNQKNRTDIFGFGQHFRSRIPYDELKNWREAYLPKLIVNFQVHVRME